MKLKDLFIETSESFDVLFDPIEGVITLECLDRNIRLTLKGEHDTNTKRYIMWKLEAYSIEGRFSGCRCFEDLAETEI